MASLSPSLALSSSEASVSPRVHRSGYRHLYTSSNNLSKVLLLDFISLLKPLPEYLCDSGKVWQERVNLLGGGEVCRQKGGAGEHFCINMQLVNAAE